MAFIDYKKAFDSAKNSRLWKILKYMGLCVKMVDTLKRLYQQQQPAVRVDSELTDWFDISNGA